jgi:PKD repeat protein
MKFSLARVGFLLIAVLAFAACRTEELPNLSRDQLFITITAAPSTVNVKGPGENRATSQITAILQNQDGEPLAGETLLFSITDQSGRQIVVGTLSATQAVTDSTGAARVTYTAPNSNEQPGDRQIFIAVQLINPSLPFEVRATQALNLKLTGTTTQCTIAFVPQNPIVGVVVNFTATVPNAGTLILFEWEFGDTTSAVTALNAVSHLFTSQGSFEVTLTATNSAGDEFTCKTDVDVGGSSSGAPRCSFTSNPNPSCTGQSVNFNGTGSDPDGGPVTFSWSFGSTQEDASNTFSSEGIKTITLTVTDDENQTCRVTGKQVVLGPPTISGFNPSSGAPGQSVTINGSNLITGGTLRIGGALVNSFTVNGNGTQITATVPSSAVDGTITFNNGCGTGTSSSSFDVCGALSISGSPTNNEGTGGSTTGFDFTVNTTETCSVAQSAVFNTSGCGTDPANGADFGGAFPGGTVTVAANASSNSLIIGVSHDTDVEQNECFRVTISSPTNATLGTPTSADGTITNDD